MLKEKYRGFNVNSILIKNENSSHMKLLQRAIASNKSLESIGKKNTRFVIESTYVVFDGDNIEYAELLRCRKFAKRNGIKIIFSNINFEIWILMHFEPVSKSYTKQELYTKLSKKKYFNTDYERFKGNDLSPYLANKVNVAMANADRLSINQNRESLPNPFTNVNEFLPEIFTTDKF
ncbi:MAG: RloB family protein [Companilactobacillus sp.]|nr:RloB family protein [Companilactobacillus sp.]MCH4052332.1 RloB family protein [Companilactobacillus sp.]MCH4077934.1 RloB family protein [Companilactobacillus sp.]MCH4126510.1 RloB family protein [Companilactobacillus sp.]MCH4132096.1 RloB family protein [Companilactobacillus sp.]